MKTVKKGTRAERKLRELLEKNNYLVIRAAGSGYNSPDLIAMKAGRATIIEVKSTSKKALYFREEQYLTMKRFYEEGFNVIIAVYNKGKFRFYNFTNIVNKKLDLNSFYFTDLFLI